MRTMNLLCAIVGLSLADETLEETYGPTTPVDNMRPWYESSNEEPNQQYFDVRSPENCTFPIDVVILQDTTAAFTGDLERIPSQLKQMAHFIAKTHPNSRYGLMSFRDKPVWGFGEYKDFCQKFEIPLNTTVEAVVSAYGGLKLGGGGDPANNQFGALVAASQSETPGWATSSTPASKILMVVTSSRPHFAGDGMNSFGMKPFSGGFNVSMASMQCLQEYYPEAGQVRDAVDSREAYVSTVLVASGDTSVESEWQWVNGYLSQTNEFVQHVANDMADLSASFAAVVKEIEGVECILRSTTPPPTASTGSSAGSSASSSDISQTTVTESSGSSSSSSSGSSSSSSSSSSSGSSSSSSSTETTGSSSGAVVSSTEAPTSSVPLLSSSTSHPGTASGSDTGPSTTEELLTPVGSVETQTSMTAGSEPTTDDDECPPIGEVVCEENDEVVIKLKHRPVQMHLQIDN